MMVEETLRFTEAEVEDWCKRAGDYNELHLNKDAVSESSRFDTIVVPGMMLLDKVSGLITIWAGKTDDTATPVISSLNDIMFNEPVYINESVTAFVEDTEVSDGRATLEFGIRESADSFSRASGRATVYLV